MKMDKNFDNLKEYITNNFIEADFINYENID